MRRHAIIQWGSCLVTDLSGKRLSEALGVEADFARPLGDALSVGPHHPDLRTQAALRRAYFHRDYPNAPEVERYLKRLREGQHLVLWGTYELDSCLALLWLLDALQCHGVPWSEVTLVATPEPPGPYLDAAALKRLFAARIPAAEVAADLIALRHRIAAPDWDFQVDRRSMPEPVRFWAGVLERLTDFLPDTRGLDLFDGLLLDGMTAEWSCAVHPVVHALKAVPRENSIGDLFLWERIVQMSDKAHVFGGWSQFDGTELCELRIDGPAALRFAQVRLTGFGKRVRAGRADALKKRDFGRWIGGRFLTSRSWCHGRDAGADFPRRNAAELAP